MILSTHIIEEVAGMIEEIIILHDGKVLRQAAVEDLLAGHYQIAGPEEAMQAYLADKSVLHTDFGQLLTATVEGGTGTVSGFAIRFATGIAGSVYRNNR